MVSQSAIIGVVVTACLFYSVFAQDPMKCKGQDVTISDDKAMNVMDCLNATGAATPKDVPKDQMGCFMKCVMSKQGLVDDNGSLKKDNISSSIAAGIPDPIKMPLTLQVGQCFDQAGGKVDMNDPACAAFTPLCDCIKQAYTTLCK